MKRIILNDHVSENTISILPEFSLMYFIHIHLFLILQEGKFDETGIFKYTGRGGCLL